LRPDAEKKKKAVAVPSYIGGGNRARFTSLGKKETRMCLTILRRQRFFVRAGVGEEKRKGTLLLATHSKRVKKKEKEDI